MLTLAYENTLTYIRQFNGVLKSIKDNGADPSNFTLKELGTTTYYDRWEREDKTVLAHNPFVVMAMCNRGLIKVKGKEEYDYTVKGSDLPSWSDFGIGDDKKHYVRNDSYRWNGLPEWSAPEGVEVTHLGRVSWNGRAEGYEDVDFHGRRKRNVYAVNYETYDSAVKAYLSLTEQKLLEVA